MNEVIAELCQNHNGDMGLLEEMVYAAAECGATYAKIQSMRADDLTKRERFENGKVDNGRVLVIKRPHEAEYQRLKPMDISDEYHYRFIEFCRKANIKPMTTVFSRSRVPFVTKLGLDTIKVSSFDCASIPLIKDLLSEGKQRVIVSTGVTFDHEIEATVEVLRGRDFCMLHCVSIYPTPLEHANLNRLGYLRRFTPHVGISDHSNPEHHGVKLSAAAVLLGAKVVERHFTILAKDKTKDGPVSVNPQQLKELVSVSKMEKDELESFVEKFVPEFEIMKGSEARQMSETETLNRDYYRGRFASKANDGSWVYNWEDREV